MSKGMLFIVGLGPGPGDWVTPRVQDILGEVSDVIGYGPYVARIPDRDGLIKHASDNRVELDRARLALQLAAEGKKVAVVSGGDPGVFAMASAVMEAIDADGVRWLDVPVSVEPGVTAMLAAAARAGAPLGGDFVAINLSDNLKPWAVIEKRLRLAAEADFAMAFYNPASMARPDRIFEVFDLLRSLKAGSTPVILAQDLGRTGERLIVFSLEETDVSLIDMRTLVIVGSSTTKIISRPRLRPLVYTPRFIADH